MKDLVAVAICLLLCITSMRAQDITQSQDIGQSQTKNPPSKVQFAYGVNFDFDFDNREFDAGKERFTESMTLFGARLTPSIGINVRQNKSVSHKIMLGIDVMKEFGNRPVNIGSGPESDNKLENTKLFREITLYYGLNAKIGDCQIEGYAGMFPRRFSEGSYTKAFFSDSLLFYDNNLEGMLIKMRSSKSFIEAAADWRGKYGDFRREEFVLFGHGYYQFTKWFKVGFTMQYHHYANTSRYGSVVDNGLVHPFACFEFEKFTRMQELSLKLGWYQGLQQDRRLDFGTSTPSGAEAELGIRKWNVGIRNTLYFGEDLMTFYNSTDAEGFKYGNNVYYGSPFYRVHASGNTGQWGMYNKMEIYYEPYIADFMNIRIGAIFHFPEGFRFGGTQQKVSISFNLDKIL